MLACRILHDQKSCRYVCVQTRSTCNLLILYIYNFLQRVAYGLTLPPGFRALSDQLHSALFLNRSVELEEGAAERTKFWPQCAATTGCRNTSSKVYLARSFTISQVRSSCTELEGGLIVYGALKQVMGIRMSEEDERRGADLSIHKVGANPESEMLGR